MNSPEYGKGGHTPGPYHVGGKHDLLVYAKNGWPVANAVVYHNQHPIQESAANAKLFAASPELLEACQIALEDYEAKCAGGRRMRIEEIMTRLRMAIEKAGAL